MTQNKDGTGESERDLVKTFLSRGKKIRLLDFFQMMMLLPVLENRLREGNNFHSCEQQPKKTLIHFFRKKTFDGNRCADLQIFFHDNKWKHFAKHAINKNKF